MKAPLYNIQESVYLAESAALGFLEAYTISDIQVAPDGSGWVYGFAIKERQAVVTTFGDRITKQLSGSLYFSEDELITACAALPMIRSALQQRLTKVNAMIASICPPGT